jgi:hypothetical protein
VPKLKVAVGSAGVVALGDPDEGEGDGAAVQEVAPSARRTAPVVRTVRRDGLLGTRGSPLDFAGSAACGPGPSLIDGFAAAREAGGGQQRESRAPHNADPAFGTP